MASGTIKWFDAQKRYGFIRTDDKELFFHINQVIGLDKTDLTPGRAVEFDEAQGKKGIEAHQVRAVGAPVPISPNVTGSQPGTPSAQDSPRRNEFLNPYNFVRYLGFPGIDDHTDSPSDPPGVRLLGRCAPPPHDRWVGLSGRITCKVKAETPIFISDSEEVSGGEHKTYRFFKFNGAPTIPASSLRGMVRAVFEAVTNSCFAVFDESPLSKHSESTLSSWLVPARVEKRGEEWTLRLLTGTEQLQIPDAMSKGRIGEQYAGWMRSWWPTNPSKTLCREGPHVGEKQRIIRDRFIERTEDAHSRNPDDVRHGERCYAVLRKMKHPLPQVSFWDVIEVRKHDDSSWRKLQAVQQDGDTIVEGWLCLNNDNIEAKHSERFFFRDNEKASGSETITLDEPVRMAYERLIKEYQERHEKTIKQLRDKGIDPSKPFKKKTEGEQLESAHSRFILDENERSLQDGALVYAMLSGTEDNPSVKFIVPVSVPRVSYEHGVGDLLKPDSLHHCSSFELLCPACRTFGWVRGERDEEGAYASRVRFSHARLVTPKPMDPMTLAILGEPKPTTTRFYLIPANGKPSRGRDDASAGYDGDNRLRGRKFYRHHLPNDRSTIEKPSGQNRTIEDPQDKGAEFQFTVYFENLAPVELGALLWTLEVGGKGYHRLGYGKPLGLGSVVVSIVNSGQDVPQVLDAKVRYTNLNNAGYVPLANWGSYVEEFKAAARARWSREFEQLEPVQDLLAILGKENPPSLPVYYPFSREQGSQGAFEWFVGNKRKEGPKLELDLAPEDKGLPFIDKKGRVG